MRSHLERDIVGQEIVLMQDNHPKHTAKLCQKYVKQRGKAYPSNDVSVQSADLNPVELLWAVLDRKVRAKQPTSGADFW